MSVTAKPLPVELDTNSNASNGPMIGIGIKKAVRAGRLPPIICDRKESTIINDHAGLEFRRSHVQVPL